MEQHLSHYKIFYEVARLSNISKAAKELYISQPAISKSISKLEESLDITLFTRNSRGVTLTVEGQLLFEHINEAFSAISLGEKQIKRMKDFKMGKIRIGVSNALCRYVLLPKLKQFVMNYPHVMINISSQSTSSTETMLENGLLDLGVVAFSGSKKNFIFRKIMDVHDVFVASPEYISNVRLREGNDCNLLTSSNLMMLDKNNNTRRYVDSFLEIHRIIPNQLLEVTTLDLLIEFAKIGLGIACVIREFVEDELRNGTLIEIPTDFTIDTRSIGYHYAKNNPNPTLHLFLEHT